MADPVSTVYDPIMDALLALLEASCGSTFKTYSRRFLMWEALINSINNNTAPAQPALYLYDGPGLGGGVIKYENRGRGPSKRTLTRTIVIYGQIPGGGTPGGIDAVTPGGSVFYPLLEAVEAALEPSPSDSFGTVTLGGLVTHCWIEGDGIIVTGEIDPSGQGMATIPVNIVIP